MQLHSFSQVETFWQSLIQSVNDVTHQTELFKFSEENLSWYVNEKGLRGDRGRVNKEDFRIQKDVKERKWKEENHANQMVYLPFGTWSLTGFRSLVIICWSTPQHVKKKWYFCSPIFNYFLIAACTNKHLWLESGPQMHIIFVTT